MAWDIVIGCGASGLILFVSAKRFRDNGNIKYVDWLVFSFLTGFAIYSGIVAIIYGMFGIILFGENNLISEKIIAIFGGLTLVGVSLQALLNKEKLKTEEKPQQEFKAEGSSSLGVEIKERISTPIEIKKIKKYKWVRK